MKTLIPLFICFVICNVLAAETFIEDITASETWTLAGSPYIVSGSRLIYNNATVTIEAGVHIRFNSGAGLVLGNYSQGNIVANGTLENPIVFTSNAATPAPGDWNNIRTTVWCWASSFNHCVFDYGGSSNGVIHVQNGNPQFNNSVFRHSANSGIFSYTYDDNSMSVDNCTFTDNAKTVTLGVQHIGRLGSGNQYLNNTDNRVHCQGGTLNANSTWTTQPVPIYFIADLQGGNGSAPVLVIPNGSILEFAAGKRVYLASGDVIRATGVTFRGEQATPGFWKGFDFSGSAGNSLISGCTIRDAGHGNRAALKFENVNSIVTGSTITNCSAGGIWLTYNCLQSISANTITGCGSYPLSLVDESVRVLGEGNNFSGNTLNMVEVRAWSIQSSGVWRNPGVPYYLTGSTAISNVSPFPHIEIQPGTVVMLPHQARITIGNVYSSYQGSLEATGVTFTRSSPTAVPYGLYFYHWVVSEQSVFTDCVFEYMGQNQDTGAVHVLGQGPRFNNCTFRYNPYSAVTAESGGKVTVTNCSFNDNGSYPIRLRAIDFDSLNGAGCIYSGNNPNRILLYSSNLTEAKTYVWNNPGTPVEVSGEISVSGSWPTPSMLKLSSGLVLLFSGNYMRIGNVNGSYPGGIQANGVTFSALNGTMGGWNGLYVDYSVTQDSYLRNCVIEYASQGNVYSSYSTLPVIESCIIRYGVYGIRLEGNYGSPSIIRNYIMDNTTGVYCNGMNYTIGGSSGDDNCIAGNTLYGVHNAYSSVTVDATHNWWGHPSGPYHSSQNPAGQGDNVSNYVLFDPWRASNIGDAPARFHLLLPANYSVLQTLTPLLDWEDAIDPTPGDMVTYTVQLALNSGFTTGLISFSGLSSSFKQIPASTLADDTRYYWRVLATDTQNQTTYNYEPNFYFDTAVPEAPQPFALLSPAYNGTVNFTSNLLTWEEAIDPDAGDMVTYTVYRDISAGFESPEILYTSNTYVYTGFCAPGGLYYWKVEATDLTQRSTFSPVWRFFVDWNAKPRAPVYFTVTAMGLDIMLDWDSVPGAETYDVYSSSDPSTGFSLLQAGIGSSEYLHVGAGTDPRRFYYVTSHDYQ